jgi:hypothetical protein
VWHQAQRICSARSFSLLRANARGRPLADGRGGRGATRAWGSQARPGTAAVRRPDESMGFSCRRHGGRATMPSMRTIMTTLSLALFPLLAFACGGEIDHVDGGAPSGGSSPSSGSVGGSSSGSSSSGSGSGGSTTSDASSQSEGGSSDAAVVCTQPPESMYGGQCTFCDDEWYCPLPQNPLPACPAGVRAYDSCGQYTSGCIACTPDGSITNWFCVMGEFALPTRRGYSCSP